MSEQPDEPTSAVQWPPASGLPPKSHFKKAVKLKWGETPFDSLSRAELLRLVQAYHSALTSTSSCLKMSRAINEDSPYWGEDGSGGRALAKSDFLFSLCGAAGTDQARERIYRSFFRTADTLLFGAKPGSFDDWGIKIGGDEMIAPRRDDPAYRPIEWRDLLPQGAQAPQVRGG
jgi:hypothetical protein